MSDEIKDVIKTINRVEQDLGQRIDDLEENMEIYGAMFRTEPGQKAAQQVRRYYQVLDHAEKERKAAAPSQEGVTLKPNEIAAAADCTRAHAYNIIEDMAEWDPSTCELKDDPVALRIKWNGTTRKAADQLERITEVTAQA